MIKVAIVGYGNLGKGVEQAITLNKDMKLFGVFSRRDKDTVKTNGSNVYPYSDLLEYKDEIDVCILCGSSDKDLRRQSVELSKHFNLVDSFDIHTLIPEHLANVDKQAHPSQKTAIVSVGWDPGIFSMQRALLDSILPNGKTESFWGFGVSQGHSEVVRRIEGVKDALQYSIPNEESIDDFKEGKEITDFDKHERRCYVVADALEHERIEKEILNTEHYFKGSNTKVIFISQEEMDRDHQGMPHGGHVLRRAKTSESKTQLVDFQLKLDSNPEFTASILVAFARAAYRMNQAREFGGFTSLDVKPFHLSSKSRNDLIKEML